MSIVNCFEMSQAQTFFQALQNPILHGKYQYGLVLLTQCSSSYPIILECWCQFEVFSVRQLAPAAIIAVLYPIKFECASLIVQPKEYPSYNAVDIVSNSYYFDSSNSIDEKWCILKILLNNNFFRHLFLIIRCYICTIFWEFVFASVVIMILPNSSWTCADISAAFGDLPKVSFAFAVRN